MNLGIRLNIHLDLLRLHVGLLSIKATLQVHIPGLHFQMESLVVAYVKTLTPLNCMLINEAVLLKIGSNVLFFHANEES